MRLDNLETFLHRITVLANALPTELAPWSVFSSELTDVCRTGQGFGRETVQTFHHIFPAVVNSLIASLLCFSFQGTEQVSSGSIHDFRVSRILRASEHAYLRSRFELSSGIGKWIVDL
jgi:hypothetical protein